MAFQRLGSDQVEARRILEAEYKLAIRELIDARQLDFDDRSQQRRERRTEIAAKALVQRLQRPHLLFADPLGAFEIVRYDLFTNAGRGFPRAAQAGFGLRNGIPRGLRFPC